MEFPTCAALSTRRFGARLTSSINTLRSTFVHPLIFTYSKSAHRSAVRGGQQVSVCCFCNLPSLTRPWPVRFSLYFIEILVNRGQPNAMTRNISSVQSSHLTTFNILSIL